MGALIVTGPAVWLESLPCLQAARIHGMVMSFEFNGRMSKGLQCVLGKVLTLR